LTASQIEDKPLRALREADQKMPGKAEAHRLPALGARGVQVENAQRHRQAFAAVDDPH
jgi:hypothetical protein